MFLVVVFESGGILEGNEQERMKDEEWQERKGGRVEMRGGK